MKVALITDTHAGARNDTEAFGQYFLKFYDEVFFPYLEENNITTLIHLGDVFDRRKYANFKTLYYWRNKIFGRLHEMNIDMHIIIGNHDVYYKNTNEINSPSILLGEYDNIKIYKEPETVNIGGVDILFLPWINDENYEASLEAVENTKADICMGHLEIKGFEMFRGHVNLDKGFNASLFKKFDYTFSGHFHHRSSSKNIHYLGSPYGMVWTDWNDSRGFHIFDTESRELEFIKNPFEIFHKISYDDTDGTYNSLFKKDLSFVEGSYLKIIVENKTNPYLFDQFLELIYKNNPTDVSIVEGYEEDVAEVDDEFFDQAKDNLTIITEYISTLDIPESNDVIELMRSLYMESLDRD